MIIPTEPIGSIPRPLWLVEAIAGGRGDDPSLDSSYEAAINDTIACFEAIGSPVITDGEQRKYHNFWTYCMHGMPNTAPDGFRIPFAAGHTRRMLRLTGGPFRYQRYADRYLEETMRHTGTPLYPCVETAQQVCERVLEAAEYIPLAQLGTTDDCGFSRFCDDTSTSRETAFAKIAARVGGARLATNILRGG